MLSVLTSIAFVALVFRATGISAGDCVRGVRRFANRQRPDLGRFLNDCARDVQSLGGDLIGLLDRSERAGLIWDRPLGWAHRVASRTGLEQASVIAGARPAPVGVPHPTAPHPVSATRTMAASQTLERARLRVDGAKEAFDRAREKARRARRDLRKPVPDAETPGQ